MIIKNFLKYSSSRTQNVNLNSLLSIFFKGASILLSFILVPLTIKYIKPDVYGVWLTLSSILGWISMFDIGIANGLKNKLSESLTELDYEKGKMYVSTTYVVIGLIALVFILVYFCVYQFINWQIVFNAPFIPKNQLSNTVTIVAVLFFIKFVSDIINVVAAAFQLVAISAFLNFLSNLGITISVWLLSELTTPNLVLLSFVLNVVPLLLSIVASFYLFNSSFRFVRPSFQYVNFKKSKGILSLGWQFFVLQLVTVIIFQTDNIIISQFFAPVEVTNFNVAYKYFSVLVIVFSILLTPYWTAFNEAFFNKEYLWVKKTINKLLKFFLLGVSISFFMIAFSTHFFRFWVGSSVKIQLSLSIGLCLYFTIMNWNAIFASFLNGVGKIKLQIMLAPLVGVINISASIFFLKYLSLGLIAIPLANTLSLCIGAIVSYIQYEKIINNRANGIWGK